MMKKQIFLLLLSNMLATSCVFAEKTLKESYKDIFHVGVALSTDVYKEAQANELIQQQFNSVTAENCMKPHALCPKEGAYNFEAADHMVNYALSHGMKVRGHALLWHQSAPDWFFAPENGKPATKEIIYQRLREYIHTVVKHFKGRVYCWDVVNEAISDRGDEFYRTNSVWYKACGDAEFIEKAFIYAREADPDVQLFYNDYEVVNPLKRAKIIGMISVFKSKGIPIDGVGLQGHWNISYPTQYQLESTLKQISTLGIEMHVTELDVRVNDKANGGQLQAEREANAIYELTDELVAKQEKQYKMIFDTFRKYKHNIQSVTFWNVHDGNTWLDLRTNNVGKNFPLLFDENMQPKSSYYKVTQF